MGTGILNWTFALPAFFTIDTYGRRPLLLITYPFLALSLLWTGMSFFIDADKFGANAENFKSVPRVAMVTTGMYIFECFYSPGMGPVPFSYSAEAFPIQVRDVGMSWATATTWCFNFLLSFSWPALVAAFKPQGAFGWYAAWCIILWILVLLFMPETKGRDSLPSASLNIPIQRAHSLTLIFSLQNSPSKNSTKSSPCRHGSTPPTKSRTRAGTSTSTSSSSATRSRSSRSTAVRRS